MTYCVGFLLEAGLVFASDSRTNAGVDYISSYSKMHVFQPAPDRLFVLLTAGNLATAQAVLHRIRRDIADHQAPEGGGGSEADGPTLLTARHLFEAADYVGGLSVAVQQKVGANLRQTGASADVTFILGGQIAGEPHGLFLIYPQGNAISATSDTPFLQIGESKYGKPPLDYVGHSGMSLEDAGRLCLVSQIITRRSNLTVGPPFEIAMVARDELRVSRRLKLGKEAPEINRTMETWSRTMTDAIQRLPRFAWEEDPL
jgi:putative proteasome-type protease